MLPPETNKWPEKLPEITSPMEPVPTMIKLNGSSVSFRCELCGANVFTKTAPYVYSCNGCQTIYRGE